MWQAECSSTKHRGAMVVMDGCFISGGIALAQWISFGLFYASSTSIQWRIPVAFPIIFSIFVLISTVVAPESPRWLVKKGRMNEARQVLAELRNTDPDSPQVAAEIAEIECTLLEVQGSLRELLRNTKERLLHRTALAMVGQSFQQLCGISGTCETKNEISCLSILALVFYSAEIFGKNLKFSSSVSRIIAGCFGVWQTFGGLIAIVTIDRIGRRALLMLATGGASICMAVVAGITGPSSTTTDNIVATVFFFLFGLFYILAFPGVTFLYAAEVAPLRFRIPIVAIANATQWLCQFLVAQITPIGTSNLDNRYWIIYAVLNAAFFPIVYFFFPETTGLSLETIDQVFIQSNDIFSSRKIAQRLRKTGANLQTIIERGEVSRTAVEKTSEAHVNS